MKKIIISILLLILLTGCKTEKTETNIETPDCLHVSLGKIEDNAEFVELIPMMTYVFKNGELLYSTSMGYIYIQEDDGKVLVINETDRSKGYYVDIEKYFFQINADEMIDYVEGKKVEDTLFSNRLSYESSDFNLIIYGLEDDNSLSGISEGVTINITLDPLEFIVEDETISYKFKFMTQQFCLKQGDSYLCDDESEISDYLVHSASNGDYMLDFIEHFGDRITNELYGLLLKYFSMTYDYSESD